MRKCAQEGQLEAAAGAVSFAGLSKKEDTQLGPDGLGFDPKLPPRSPLPSASELLTTFPGEEPLGFPKEGVKRCLP